MSKLVSITAHPRFRPVREAPLSKTALANHLGVSARSIERRMNDGMPHTRNHQGHARFFLSDVEGWLAERKAS